MRIRVAGARAGVILASLLLSGCGGSVPDNSYQAPPPPEVTVAKPVQRTVTLYLDENGETEAVERAEVRARVRGFLEEIKFLPAQRVTQGDVLYVIQRDEYAAAVNSAQASLAAAKAAVDVSAAQVGVVEVEVTRAEFEYNRFKSLLEKEAATQAQYDQAQAAYQSAEANHDAAEANVEAAKADRDQAEANLERSELDLDYTEVKAPIGGKVTKTEVKKRNLVENGDLLATVVNRDRIYANFNVSDRAVLQMQKAAREEKGDGQQQEEDRFRGMEAYLQREGDVGYPFTGVLDYVDQEGVDQATGTFAVRAVFDNPDDLILPGLFVRVRVPIGELKDALLIPEQALSRDQVGAYVFLVNAENKIERRNVTPGEVRSGLIVIEQGLQPEDQVVLEGGQRVRPGIAVKPTVTSLSAPPGLSGQDARPEQPAPGDTGGTRNDGESETAPAQP